MEVGHSCYCCQNSVGQSDVDRALDELGMLSTVTDSRKQYLRERGHTEDIDSTISELGMPSLITHGKNRYSRDRSRTRSESSVWRRTINVSAYKVIVQDRKFLTSFSTGNLLEADNVENEESNFTDVQLENDPVVDFGNNYRNVDNVTSMEMKLRHRVRMSRFRAGRYRRFRKPYEVPWRLYHSFQDSDLSTEEKHDSPQSKSNSSSPVKSSCSLTRSRSLDNLDFAKLKLTDLIDSETDNKRELETVSKHLQNLQFNE